MDIVGPINQPGLGSSQSPRQVDVATTARDQLPRTTVILNCEFIEGPANTAPVSCTEHAAPQPRRLTCLALVERIIGDWASTLRAALLLAIILLGLIILIIVGLGLGGVAVATGLTAALRLMLRQRRKLALA